jgi:hypothetical protein
LFDSLVSDSLMSRTVESGRYRPGHVVRDVAEVLVVVAVGGMLWSAVTRLRRGQARPVLCPGCGRAVSRVYGACPHCDHPLAG